MIELHARDLNTIGLAANQITRQAKRQLEQGQPLQLAHDKLNPDKALRTMNGADIHATYTTEQGDTIGYTFHVIHH